MTATRIGRGTTGIRSTSEDSSEDIPAKTKVHRVLPKYATARIALSSAWWGEGQMVPIRVFHVLSLYFGFGSLHSFLGPDRTHVLF